MSKYAYIRSSLKVPIMIKLKRNRISKPHFNLRDKSDSKAPSPIFLFYNYNQEKARLKYSIGESILPSFWNQKTQKARVTALHPEYGSLNDLLAKIVVKAKKIAQNSPEIKPETFKEQLDHFLGIRSKPKDR